MDKIFDYIIIGTGFGGSISACRLAEKGYDVLVLERGRHWTMHTFPRRIHEVKNDGFWDPDENKFGLMEVIDTQGSDAMTLTAAGLGGGSLIYANVLKRMPAEYFVGWPAKINSQTLEPFYQKVLETMEASPYPLDKDAYYTDTPKTHLYKKAAANITKTEYDIEMPKISHPDLAICFKGSFPGAQGLNSHGAIQSKCNKCGECDVGCNINAKNTLDLNYLFRAQNTEKIIPHAKNAQVRTKSQVIKIEKENDSSTGSETWITTYIDPSSPHIKHTSKSKNVILCAGSIGSTKLLLEMKKKNILPNLSQTLGRNWSANGDLLGFSLNTSDNTHADKGPTITTAIDYKCKPYEDGFPHGFTIEDAGFPIGLSWYMSAKVPQVSGLLGIIKLLFIMLYGQLVKFLPTKRAGRNLGQELADTIDKGSFTQKLFVLLAMGRDRSTGQITLDESNKVKINYSYKDSQLHYERVREQMKSVSDNMGGVLIENPLTDIEKVVAVHPLGGCIIGTDSSTGVVDINGKVFNYEGLYVIDGSIIPTSIGPNPSLTIGALSEFIMSSIPNK